MVKMSTILLHQRIRNRTIDYFDTSFQEMANWGAFEFINMWYDIFPTGWDEEFVSEPVFSIKEQKSIKAFCSLVSQVADLTKEDIFSERELRELPEWVNFVNRANASLRTFEVRGRFSDEIEKF